MSLTITLKPFSCAGHVFAGGVATVPANAVTHVGWRYTDNTIVQLEDTTSLDGTGTIWISTVTADASTIVLCINHDPYMQLELIGQTPSSAAYLDVATNTTAPAYRAGRIFWDPGAKALSYYSDIDGATMTIGRELWAQVRNNSGGAISNGNVVYITGAIGKLPTVAKASATYTSPTQLLGVATIDIPNNAFGYITTFGVVNQLNTNGVAEGRALYLSATAGEYTAIPPASPNAQIVVGICLYEHGTQGAIGVRISGSSGTTGVGSLGPAIKLVEGVAFTAGVSPTVLLPSTSFSTKDAFNIHFDGVYQGADTYSFNAETQTITFTSAIPLGVDAIYVEARGFGEKGADGETPTVEAGTVTTLAAGQPATVTAVDTATGVRLDFGIPQGASGLGTGDMLKSVYDPNADGKIAVAQISGLGTAATAATTDFAPATLSSTVAGHTAALAELYPERELIVALGDETTAITAGTAKVTMRAPFAMTLTKIPRASLSTASSSGIPTIDINVAGTSVLGTNKLSIDASEKTSTTAATQTTLATTSIADDAQITFDIDVAGTGAKGPKVCLFYKRSA